MGALGNLCQFGHVFRPSAHDPGRCSYCLRSLDCAPHLPLTPRATYPDDLRAMRSSTLRGNQLLAFERNRAEQRARGAVQGGR